MSERDGAQDAELHEHEDRLDDLEDRLSTAFPTPDTPVGGAQRFRFAVPTPSTVLTLGARGSATSDGQAIGPGGVALQTVENFAAEIQRDAILDVVGGLTLHADGAARLLSLDTLGLSARSGVFVATMDGDIDLTAGHVAHTDPGYTVVPSMDVPEPTDVDTAAPRASAERSMGIWDGIFMGIAAAHIGPAIYQWFTGWIDPPGGRSPPSIQTHAAGVIQTAMLGVNTFRAMVVPAIEAAEAAAAPAYTDTESGEAKVHIHGAGGVHVTSPQKTRLFGMMGAKVDSPIKAYLRGGLYAGVKSPILTKIYGGMMASLSSEGVAKVSGRFAAVSGDYAEVKGKEAASVTSGQNTTIASATNVTLDAPFVAIGAGSNVDISAGDRTRVTSRLAVEIDGGERVRSTVGEAQVTLETDGVSIAHQTTKIDVSQQDGIRLDPGGGMHLRIDRTGMRARMLRFTSGEVTLRGRINLG